MVVCIYFLREAMRVTNKSSNFAIRPLDVYRYGPKPIYSILDTQPMLVWKYKGQRVVGETMNGQPLPQS